jgi:hypothetical protein
VLDIYKILNAGLERLIKRAGADWASSKISPSVGFETIFEQFEMNIAAYQQGYSGGKSNYSGIKSKPLIKLEDGSYLILSWPFLQNKMYEGLLFDFYQHSGIKTLPEFKEFRDLKKLTGGDVTEKYLCQKLLSACFTNKNQVLKFDDTSESGLPDAYYRQGNNVMLIEIKDVYFAAKAINSYSYEKIVGAINEKWNNPKKGTGQLVKQLKSLVSKPFEDIPGYKKNANVIIYPVLVYGDVLFSMPGINDFVERSFRKEIIAQGLDKPFKKIMPLTMIDIAFLITNFHRLDHNRFSLIQLIQQFHSLSKEKRRQAERSRNLGQLIAAYPHFEEFALPKLLDRAKEVDYVVKCVDIFNLTEGLPTGLT